VKIRPIPCRGQKSRPDKNSISSKCRVPYEEKEWGTGRVTLGLFRAGSVGLEFAEITSADQTGIAHSERQRENFGEQGSSFSRSVRFSGSKVSRFVLLGKWKKPQTGEGSGRAEVHPFRLGQLEWGENLPGTSPGEGEGRSREVVVLVWIRKRRASVASEGGFGKDKGGGKRKDSI